MRFEDIPIDIQIKIIKKQKYIQTTIDLLDLGYILRKRRKKQSGEMIIQWMEKEYSRIIFDKEKEGQRKAAKRWGIEHKEEIKEKKKINYEKTKDKRLKRRREYRQEHLELVRVQERKSCLKHREKRRKANKKGYWEHHEERLKAGRKYAAQHKEETRKRWVKWDKENPEKVRAAHHRHIGKGFIPLNRELDEKSDWHHVHKDLPFVISIPRMLHRMHSGMKHNHCDLVNVEAGLKYLVEMKTNISSKEYVAEIIYDRFPQQFGVYLLGFNDIKKLGKMKYE